MIDRLRERLRYDPASGKLFWRRNGREAFTADNGRGYRCSVIDGKALKAHRVVFAIMTGRWPTEIDHINGDRSDNRWANLREVDRQTNSTNRRIRIDNTSGRVGIRRRSDTGKWTAFIGGQKRRHLGQFDTEEQAVAARRAAEREHGYHPNHGRK